ncbi:MAG: hypothetical protein QOH26_946 [Actinomycetota bacterium]|jgi:hypothetical protein|nr:hypothetical protein [Actinomycetota bacterium]
MWQSLAGDVDRRVRLGRILGLTFIAGGFVVLYFGWNGAASRNFVQGQFPYLLSGGFTGLSLVVTGSTLLLIASSRAERQVMTDKFDELSLLLGRTLNRMQVSPNGSSDGQEQVIAGTTVYHRAGCKILEGKTNLTTLSIEQAVAEGLEACRACEPPGSAEKAGALSSAGETPNQ